MKEILKNLVETTTLPEDSYLDQDAEILEIFVEEIEEIFVELNALFPEWLSNPDHQENLKTIRRHFHTLKGSGRMVGAKSAGEMAWAVEDTLNRVLSGSIQLTPTVQKFAQAVLNVYQYALYPKFKHVQQLDLDLRPMVLLGQQLQQQISPEPALEELLALADHLTAEGQMTGLELADNEPSEVELTIAPVEVPVRSDIEETVAIFIEEAEEHLDTIATFLRTEDEKSQDYNALIRAIHTLRGSSSMAQIEQIFEASSKVEHLFKTLLQDEIASTSKETALLIQYAEFVSDYLHLLRQGNTAKLDAVYATFERVWHDYGFAVTETNSIQTQGLVSKLVELDIDLLLDAEFEFDKRAQVDYPEYIQALSQQAAELLAHTESRAAQGIHEFTADLKSAYDALLEKPVLLNSDYAYELFAQAHQEFIHLFDTLAAGQRVILNDEIQKILSELSAFVQQDLEIFAEDTSNQNVELSSESTQVAETVATGSVDFAGLSQRIAADRQQQQSTETNRDFDEELLSIFLEEADELLAGIDEDLNTWSKKQDDTTSLNNLMRHLHTLKGGANMIAALHIGLIAHELESIYERVIRQQIAVTPALIQIIRLVQDNVSDRIQSIREDGIDYPAPEAIAILQNIQVLVSGQAVAAAESANTVVEVAEVQATSISEPQLEESATTEHPATDLAEAEELLEILESPEATEDIPVERSEEDELKSIVEESFLEESEEILANAEKLLNQWFDQRSDRSLLLQLQRAAHSIKGGARMIDVEEVASIAYELETTFEQFAVYQFNSNAYDGLLQKTLVWLRQAIFQHDYNGFDQLYSSLKKDCLCGRYCAIA